MLGRQIYEYTIHTAEPLVPEPSVFEVEMAINPYLAKVENMVI
jgi:hypothetical protein